MSHLAKFGQHLNIKITFFLKRQLADQLCQAMITRSYIRKSNIIKAFINTKGGKMEDSMFKKNVKLMKEESNDDMLLFS